MIRGMSPLILPVMNWLRFIKGVLLALLSSVGIGMLLAIAIRHDYPIIYYGLIAIAFLCWSLILFILAWRDFDRLDRDKSRTDALAPSNPFLYRVPDLSAYASTAAVVTAIVCYVTLAMLDGRSPSSGLNDLDWGNFAGYLFVLVCFVVLHILGVYSYAYVGMRLDSRVQRAGSFESPTISPIAKTDVFRQIARLARVDKNAPLGIRFKLLIVIALALTLGILFLVVVTGHDPGSAHLPGVFIFLLVGLYALRNVLYMVIEIAKMIKRLWPPQDRFKELAL